MRPLEYFDMLPLHFYAMADGYLRREYKNSADVRKLAYLTILPHVDTKKHPFSFDRFIKDYWPLAYDNRDDAEAMPDKKTLEEEYEERKKLFRETLRKHNPRRYKMLFENGKTTDKK